MRKSNYDKFPSCLVQGFDDACWSGWPAIARQLSATIAGKSKAVIAIECYPGVHEAEILDGLQSALSPVKLIRTSELMLDDSDIDAMVQQDLTDDPVFGHLTQLKPEDFFDRGKLLKASEEVTQQNAGLVLIVGFGASLVCSADLLVYADLARWEAQMRFRRDAIGNLGVQNHALKWSLQYKRAFFVDWRVADRLKKRLIEKWDFVLDTNVPDEPKLATGEAVREGLRQVARRPFRVVPFFDPAPWGGQWMKEVCDLDRSVSNYGWCFDCVPEENSLFLQFGQVRIEIPSINLVFYQPRQLLGDAVHGRFGTEFPIRFDFLDTVGGGNLSFQVHPLTEYMQENFGMHYTQDESYYMLDAGDDAYVYLGFKTGATAEKIEADLKRAQAGDFHFPADDYVNRIPAKKHDHFLIPAGTVHCSGAESMVLEISATPYIFTFKMWDWGRMGLDGRPRPVHLDHGIANIAWDRDTEFVERELVDCVTPVASGPGWTEERTGLHKREFIETRRHWFTDTVSHDTGGGVNVLNLVEGNEVIVESPTGAFAPYVVHYAETFIVPAGVGAYTIRPHGDNRSQQYATLKAFVRTGHEPI